MLLWSALLFFSRGAEAVFVPRDRDELRNVLRACGWSSDCTKDGSPISEWDVSKVTAMT